MIFERRLLWLLLFITNEAIAENSPNYLVIWAKDSSRVTYKLSSKPKITFTETNMVVKANGVEEMYELENLARFTYTSILPGDVNGDGEVNEVDAQQILDVSVGLKSLSDLRVPAAINVPGGNSNALEVNAQIVLDYSVAAVKPW